MIIGKDNNTIKIWLQNKNSTIEIFANEAQLISNLKSTMQIDSNLKAYDLVCFLNQYYGIILCIDSDTAKIMDN